ncbi:hypothetical protein D3C71_169060 [compost metagenome]
MAKDWTSFELKIAVKAGIQDMYHAWTQAELVEKWFLQECTYLRDEAPLAAEETVHTGDTYAWRWYFYEETEHGEIREANGKDFLQFSFAGNCLVDVQLEPAGDYTLVRLRQHNIPTDEASQFGIRIGCVEGWTFYLTNLKSVYEYGHDLRNTTHPELRGVNN